MANEDNPKKAGSIIEGQTAGKDEWGFQDPTGEFPRKKYWKESSVNKAAVGIGGVAGQDEPNDLMITGTFKQIDLGLEPKEPSTYPFNEVKETHSGHVIELDDTKGAERILIRHRTGAGIEIRPDGTIYISSVQNKVETVGSDMKVIVEGDTKLAYKGNVDMYVEGNFNLDVGGNYNKRVAGNKNETISDYNSQLVGQNNNIVVKGNHALKVMENNLDVCLGASRQTVTDGTYSISTEGNMTLATDEVLMLSGKDEATMVSKNVNITGMKVSALGLSGTIGGSGIGGVGGVDFYGKTYQGGLGPIPFASGATFYGTFMGQSLESLSSLTAFSALKSATAGSLGAGGVGYPVTPKLQVNAPSGPPPLPPIVGVSLMGGGYAIKTVTVDEGGILKKKILQTEDYGGVFPDNCAAPTTDDMRSAFRDPNNKANLFSASVRDGIVNEEGEVVTPPEIGRTSGKDPSSIIGTKPLGNTNENQGKRVTRGTDQQTKDELVEIEKEKLATAQAIIGTGDSDEGSEL